MLSFSGWTPNVLSPCTTTGRTNPLLAQHLGSKRNSQEAPITAVGREEEWTKQSPPLGEEETRPPLPALTDSLPCPGLCPQGHGHSWDDANVGSAHHIWGAAARLGARPAPRTRVRARPPAAEAARSREWQLPGRPCGCTEKTAGPLSAGWELLQPPLCHHLFIIYYYCCCCCYYYTSSCPPAARADSLGVEGEAGGL